MNLEKGNNTNNNENIENTNLIKENIENIKKLKHPNLLDYIEIFYKEDNNKLVIITELLQGGNLNEYRKYQKKLKVKLVKKWIKQLLSALDYLHSNNFIHHDIKSQNILIDRITGNIKLGDLICAEKLGEQGYFTKYIGTEEFMAPEVKEGKYTFKADIYSLGLTIIQFITMEKPYKEFNRKKSLYLAKKRGEYPLIFKEIKNEQIKNFISLCLKEEKERPTCKELLQNKWLNDKNSPDNNSFIELDNEFKIMSKSKSSFKFEKEYNNICFSKSNNQINIVSPKTSSYRHIYSLDISKLNDKDSFVKKDKNKNEIKFKSFRNMNIFNKEPITKIKSLFHLKNLSETNNKENKVNKEIFSDRGSKKQINKILGDNEIKDELIKNNLMLINLYIIEDYEKLVCILNEKEEKYENILIRCKIILSKKNLKNQKFDEIKFEFKLNYEKEKNNFDLILNELKNLIELNEKDICLIKTKLEGKINITVKRKKINKLKEEIDKIIRNFQFLINNDEFDYLEYLINDENFDESKLPKEINEKLNFYKLKKSNIENLFCLHNIFSNDDIDKNKYISQEDLVINLFENNYNK